MAERDDRLTTEDLASGTTRADDPSERGHEAGADRGQPGDDRLDRPGERDEPLMPPNDLQDYQRRWEAVQTGFVDEPRRAVEDADALVAEAMKQLADSFAAERAGLEEQWDRSGEVDTEALRVTLQRYRSFFNRLVST